MTAGWSEDPDWVTGINFLGHLDCWHWLLLSFFCLFFGICEPFIQALRIILGRSPCQREFSDTPIISLSTFSQHPLHMVTLISNRMPSMHTTQAYVLILLSVSHPSICSNSQQKGMHADSSLTPQPLCHQYTCSKKGKAQIPEINIGSSIQKAYISSKVYDSPSSHLLQATEDYSFSPTSFSVWKFPSWFKHHNC